MNFIAPGLLAFALLVNINSLYAQSSLPAAVITATVTDQAGHSRHLYSNVGFETFADCQTLLDRPPPFLQAALDQVRVQMEADGLTVVFACEPPKVPA